ncbi:MAG TPA: hypothetical protein DF409_16545 [Bacteroidales bacterium]|nr:hypothetical protein [Bacteroidales bacterium]
MAYIFESEAFAQAIKLYRKNKKITQQVLADELLIARPTINLLENQKVKPTREQIEIICTKINQPISNFFHQEQVKPLLYMMGNINSFNDKETLIRMLERINIRNRYYLLNRRAN